MPGPRDWGFDYWRLPAGRLNGIGDVSGVRVGHVSVVEDEPHVARTGVSVILPDADLPREHLPAAAVVFNGTGEMTGFHQVNEWGAIESPIALTGTAGVPMALQGLVRHLTERCPEVGVTIAPSLPVVAECNDMYLSDARHCPIVPEHVAQAIASARADQPLWGDVGAGTGMVSFGFKGGIGTASRVVQAGDLAFRLGAVCLVNFGQPGDLRVLGRPMGHLPGEVVKGRGSAVLPDGSLIVVLATDAPFEHLELRRIAARAALGMARVGSHGRSGSGDIFLAFSTGRRECDQGAFVARRVLHSDFLNDFFLAAVEATEEGILNALFSSHGQTGVYGHRVEALLPDEVLRHLRTEGMR